MRRGLIDAMSPHARAATALIPFLAAFDLSIMIGKNRVTRVMLSGNKGLCDYALSAPDSVEMRREIRDPGARLR